MQIQRWHVVAAVLAFTAFQLWYIAAGPLDLAPEEALYWEYSRRLDWSYYSKGPLVAWLIRAGTWVAGDTAFGVRLPALVLSLITAAAMHALARRLFTGELVAALTVLGAIACPLFVAGAVLMTTDTPLILCWTLALLALTCARDGVRLAWPAFGLALGIGFLAKYTMLLVLPCLAVYLTLTHSWRRWGKEPTAVAGLLVAGLLALPVLWWNAAHDWVTVRHTLGHLGLAQPVVSLTLRHTAEFVGAQLGVVSPLLFAGVVVGLLRSTRLAWLGDPRHALLAAFAVPVLALFATVGVWTKVQANWAAPAYVTGLIAAAAWGETALRDRRWRGWIAAALLLGLSTSAIAQFPDGLWRAGVQVPSALRRLHPARRLQGWGALGGAVGELRTRCPDCALLSDQYQIASELAFYTPGQPVVYNVNLGRRMNQFDIWGGLENAVGRDALFVTDASAWAPEAMRGACGTLTPVRRVDVEGPGGPERSFSIFLCRPFLGAPRSGAAVTY